MRIGIIGAGAWGTALAKLSVEAGHEVAIWAYEDDVSLEIAQRGCNSRFLPDVSLPPISATSDLAQLVADKEMIISVTPSHVVRQVWREASASVTGDPIVVSATKGIEDESLCAMTEILAEELPPRLRDRIAVLSGPSFAAETARQQPTAVVVASKTERVALTVQQALGTDYFRVYNSDDVVGVEIGGAAKNVIAIAVGMSDGLGYGANARAALITRGVAETTRLALARGANALTLAGLSGIGDLVLTCTSDLSRNRRVGLRLGTEGSAGQAAKGSSVAEGIKNSRSCLRLAQRLGVEMPLTAGVHAVVYEGLDPKEAARTLMSRAQKHELHGISHAKVN